MAEQSKVLPATPRRAREVSSHGLRLLDQTLVLERTAAARSPERSVAARILEQSAAARAPMFSASSEKRLPAVRLDFLHERDAIGNRRDVGVVGGAAGRGRVGGLRRTNCRRESWPEGARTEEPFRLGAGERGSGPAPCGRLGGSFSSVEIGR